MSATEVPPASARATPRKPNYKPIIAVFTLTALMALGFLGYGFATGKVLPLGKKTAADDSSDIVIRADDPKGYYGFLVVAGAGMAGYWSLRAAAASRDANKNPLPPA